MTSSSSSTDTVAAPRRRRVRPNPWRPPEAIRDEWIALLLAKLPRHGWLSEAEYLRLRELERRYLPGPWPPDVPLSDPADLCPR